MKNNSVKISTLFNKLNQHRINPLIDQEIDTVKGHPILIDRLGIVSQSLGKNEFMKIKLDSTQDDKHNAQLGVSKQQIIKSINLGKPRINLIESNQGSLMTNSEQPFILKLKQGDAKRYPIYDHQKQTQEKKCYSLNNIKSEVGTINGSVGIVNSIKALKHQQEQGPNGVQADQLIYSIDRGFSIKVSKNKTEQFRNKKLIGSNERVQSVPTDRQMNNILSNIVNLSPNAQQSIDNMNKNGYQKKLSSSLLKSSLQNSLNNTQQPLVSTIYFNQNPYQLSQGVAVTDSNKVSTKSQSSANLIVNNMDAKYKNRMSRKTFTEYQPENKEDQHQENLSLYLLYREQQREQDKKLRELSSKQRSLRNSTIALKSNGSSIIDCLTGNKKEGSVHEKQEDNKNLNSQQQGFSLPQKQQSMKIQKAISQPNFTNNSLKRLSNNTDDYRDDEDEHFTNQEKGSRRRSSIEFLIKESRSQSLQQILAQKTNKSIQFDANFNDFDEESDENVDGKQFMKKQSYNDDEDDDEELQYPTSQAKIVSKKALTQNATMQTTFTETIPEIIARELDLIPKHNQQNNLNNNNNKKKKERLISYFSVNDKKKFLSTTSDYIKKYENDPKIQNISNFENKNIPQINSNLLITSQSSKFYNFNEIKNQNHHKTLKSLTQEDTEYPQNSEQKEIQIPITVYTSKEEFLNLLSKRIQKAQQNNIIEKKKLLEETNKLTNKNINTYSNYLDDQNSLNNTLYQNFSVGKKVVFQVESDDVLRKIKESNNPQLYELFKTYQLNGSLHSMNSMRETDQISIGPLAEQSLQKPQNKYSKGKIVCNIILKKSRNKTTHHYDMNGLLQQTSNAYKSQLLSQSLFNK